MSLSYEMKDYERFKKLTDDEVQYFHNNLCWTLMFVGMPHVTEDTIPHIVARLAMSSPEIYKWEIERLNHLEFETDLNNDERFSKYLERFISFKANVTMETTAEFVKQRFTKKLPVLASKGKDKLWSKYWKDSKEYTSKPDEEEVA